MISRQSSAGLVLGWFGNIRSVIGLFLILLGSITFTRADWAMSVFIVVPALLLLGSIIWTLDCLRFGGVRRWGRMMLSWMFTWAWGHGLDKGEPLGFEADMFSQPVLYQFSTDYGVSVIGCFCIYLVVLEAIAIIVLPGDHKRPFLDQFFDLTVAVCPGGDERESE